jgi:hypothetical protein
LNINLKNNNNSTKIKTNSSKLMPISSNTSVKTFRKKLKENKSVPSNDMTSNSLTRLDYVKSIVANNSSKLNNEETHRMQTTTTSNSKKLETLYQNIPSLLPYLNRRYDNEFSSSPNQFLLNYKQSPYYHSLNVNENSNLKLNLLELKIFILFILGY